MAAAPLAEIPTLRVCQVAPAVEAVAVEVVVVLLLVPVHRGKDTLAVLDTQAQITVLAVVVAQVQPVLRELLLVVAMVALVLTGNHLALTMPVAAVVLVLHQEELKVLAGRVVAAMVAIPAREIMQPLIPAAAVVEPEKTTLAQSVAMVVLER